MCALPKATFSTTRGLVSTPSTCHPRLAMRAAVGRPMYPSPTTQAEGASLNIGKILELSLAIDDTRDSFTCPAIAVWIGRATHRLVTVPIVQQPLRLAYNAIRIGPDQLRCSGLDALGPLGCIPQDQHRFPERWRLLL